MRDQYMTFTSPCYIGNNGSTSIINRTCADKTKSTERWKDGRKIRHCNSIYPRKSSFAWVHICLIVYILLCTNLVRLQHWCHRKLL